MEIESSSKYLPLAALMAITPIVFGLAIWSLVFLPQINRLTIIQPDFFSGLKLEAQAAVVYDPAHNETIFAKNADQVLPIASLAKLMTIYLAAQDLPPQTQVKTSDGRRWSLNNLINFTLVTSFNDGAAQLAAVAGAAAGGSTSTFVSKMNAAAGELNLTHTAFINPTGLDEGEEPGAQSTAVEVAKLMTLVAKQRPDLLTATTKPAININDLTGPQLAINTNYAANSFPGLLASKTGFTDLAHGNLAVMFDAGLNQPLVVVVLDSSEAGRITDAHQLALAAIKSLAYDR